MRVDIAVILLAICYLGRYINSWKRLYNKLKKLKIDKEQQYFIAMAVLIVAFVIYLIYVANHPISTWDKIWGCILAVGVMIMRAIREK